MRHDASAHPLSRGYLAVLNAEAQRLPADRAGDLVTGSTEHLDVALGREDQ